WPSRLPCPPARDRNPPAQTDDSAPIGQRPASFHAMHREVRPPPSRTPSRWARTGRHAATSAKRIACSNAKRTGSPASFLLPCAGLLCGQLQTAGHFDYQLGKGQAQHALARIEHHVHRALACREREPDGFAHPPLDPVTL